MIKSAESITNMDLLMETGPMVFLYGGAYIKFFSWAIQNTQVIILLSIFEWHIAYCLMWILQMKDLLLRMEMDWKSLTIKRDIQLLADCSERGRIVNNLYASTELINYYYIIIILMK